MSSPALQNDVVVCHLSKDDPRNVENISIEKKVLDSCKAVKAEANQAVKDQKFEVALAKYLTALDFLHDQSISHADYVEYVVPILNNCAHVCLSLKRYIQADEFATLVLHTAPTNGKALYRRFTARRAILADPSLLATVLEQGVYASQIALRDLITEDIKKAAMASDDPLTKAALTEWKAAYPQLFGQ